MILELRAAGTVAVSVVPFWAWPECPSLHVCQGALPASALQPRMPFPSSACAAGVEAVWHLSLWQRGTAECHCAGLWESRQQAGLGPVFWLQKSRDGVSATFCPLLMYTVPKKGKITSQNPMIFVRVV